VMSQLASCHGSNRCTCVWWHTCEASHFVMQDLSESVVVEPYQASSECVEFSVTVLGSSKGPVVLLPTEVESYDMEDDLFEAALDFEVYKARREVALLFPLLLVPLHLLLVLPMWQLFPPPPSSSCPAAASCPAFSARSSSSCSSSCLSSSSFSLMQALCLHTAWYLLCPDLASFLI